MKEIVKCFAELFKRVIIRTMIPGSALLFTFCATSQSALSDGRASSIYLNDSDQNLVLVPFFPISYKAEYHIMAYFEGDPDYESAEAFIFPEKLADGTPRIRAIMTHHGGFQEDYFNTGVTGDGHSSARPTYHSTIGWYAGEGEKEYRLGFTLKDSRKIEIFYTAAGKALSRWGGMTNVSDHSPDGGLPLFCRDASGIAAKESFVTINGRRHEITVDNAISKPPFFIAYKSYVSKGFGSFILPTFHVKKPIGLFSRRDSGEMKKIYSGITSQSLIAGGNMRFNEISEIRCASDSLSPSDSIALQFTPALPDIAAMKPGSSCTVSFTIPFNNKNSATGEMVISKTGVNRAQIKVLPRSPQWAVESRKMRYSLKWDNSSVDITSEMENRK